MDDNTVVAVAAVVAMFASEGPNKKKRKWIKSWRQRREECGLYSLQKELEISDTSGFRQMLRVSPHEFNLLLDKVGPSIHKKHTKMRLAITPQERLTLTLRFLATGESFKSLSFQFRLGASTVSNIIKETCDALYQVLQQEHLKTPTTEMEWQDIAEDFFQKWNFPNCLGAMDGKHISIECPAHSGSTFFSYKQKFTVLMMAIVDANYRFRYVSVGTQGRASDAGLFVQSDFYRALEKGLLHIPSPRALPHTNTEEPYTFVGDDAYPLRTDLMKPYSHRQLTHEQRIFNYRLSRARRVVENAFGILANRWRVFRSVMLLHPDRVSQITMAAVCLHNFLRDCRSDTYIPLGLVDTEDAEHRLVEGEWRREGLGALQPLPASKVHNYTEQAKQQRNNLTKYFVSPEGLLQWQEAYI